MCEPFLWSLLNSVHPVFIQSSSITGVRSSHPGPHGTRRQRPGGGDICWDCPCCRGLIWVLVWRQQLEGFEYEQCSAGSQSTEGSEYCWCHYTRTWTSFQSSQNLITSKWCAGVTWLIIQLGVLLSHRLSFIELIQSKFMLRNPTE